MGKTNEDEQLKEGSLVSAIIEDTVCSPKQKRNLQRMDKARAYTLETLGAYGADAVRTLVSLMQDSEKDDVRLKAAIKLLEYNVGKPSEMKHDDRDKQVKLSEDEFEEIIVEDNEQKLQEMIEKRYGKNSKR